MAETVVNGAKTGPAYPISSVDNALRLVLMLRDQPRLRLSTIATSLDIAPSTAHRLLAMLVHHGFVRQEDGLGTYVAGPALLDLGLAAVRNLDIRTYARPILADLARVTDETVHLAQLEGDRIRYLAAAESNRPLRVADRTGQLLPAHRAATGKAILASFTPRQLDEIFSLREGEEPGSGLTAAERAQLDAELADVRERGYAINHRAAEDITSVAVVVRDHRGASIAAINASAPSNRMSRKRQQAVVTELQTAAAELERLLSALGRA
ncbi:MAG: DNA-binding transcriptional regulator, IclR family [Blastococcus sp.]|jgi:IclR family acetate operon transcriptional repressor|nr:DNA-binding transcriptional regulator, IclR family [Blastococcus sp.]